MYRARCRLLVAGIAFFSTSYLTSQPTSNVANFKVSTELVLIPTSVTDKSGAHISGLKKGDFALKQDGKVQSISVFEEVKTDSARLRRAEGQNGTFSNFEPGSSGYHRLSIVLLDFVNTPPSDQAVARSELLKFLSDVAESGEPICLLALTRGGLTVLQGFSDDPKLLAAALRTAAPNGAPMIHEPVVEAGQFPGSSQTGFLSLIIRENLEGEAKMASLVGKQAVLVTVQALQEIAKAFRGLPGRKSLIWASSGFPFSVTSASESTCEPGCPDYDAYDKLWRMMNDAQIAIYSVDLRPSSAATAQSPGGVRPSDIGDPQFDTDSLAKWKMQDASTTLRLFAENTGGKAFMGGSNLVQSFHQAIQDDKSYYMIGYYVPRNSKPGWHQISVTSATKGTHVRSRRGFLLSGDTSPTSARQDTALALSSPIDFVGVPVSITWSGTGTGKSPDKTRVQFDLVMPPNFTSVDELDRNHMVVDIAAVARNVKGEVIAEVTQRIDTYLKPDGLEQIQHNGMTYRNGLQLPQGEYTVRFVVRDSLGGRIGSVAAPVKVSP